MTVHAVAAHPVRGGRLRRASGQPNGRRGGACSLSQKSTGLSKDLSAETWTRRHPNYPRGGLFRSRTRLQFVRPAVPRSRMDPPITRAAGSLAQRADRALTRRHGGLSERAKGAAPVLTGGESCQTGCEQPAGCGDCRDTRKILSEP
jgi:hypothetical protein